MLKHADKVKSKRGEKEPEDSTLHTRKVRKLHHDDQPSGQEESMEEETDELLNRDGIEQEEQKGDQGKVEHKEREFWIVGDPQSSEFGKPFLDERLIRAGVRRGPYCLVTREDETTLLLHRAPSVADFHSHYLEKAKPQIAAMEAEARKKLALLGDSRTSERRAELGHWDIIAMRPAFVPRRVIYGFVIFLLIIGTGIMLYRDEPPSLLLPVLVTCLYPIAIMVASRIMMERIQPAEKYVFEFLLVFDLYQTISSSFIFILVLLESNRLGMLRHPWGNRAEVSSPTLRCLIQLHYYNRILELLDTIFRISQKKFRTYGALHFYLRLVNVWSWFAAARVGGGDAFFITALDSAVVAIRFVVFTLSLLRLNWNIRIDFGMHAPKLHLFRKEHLYHLQVYEFAVLLLHALLALWWRSMPAGLMVMQIFVMLQGLFIFTDFYFSRDAEKRLWKRRYTESRLMISFDSSAWLFLYHFGVAMWFEDNIDKDPKLIGYSGSSGGSLVAGTLASGIDARALSTWVISNSFPVAGRNPFRLLSQCEQALDIFLPKDAHLKSTEVLRVLLTKVSSKPPFLMGEVVSTFHTWGELFASLRASCHIPLVCLLPYPVPGHGWYYDGLVWASLFVPWRTFSESDTVIKVSAFGAPGADLKPSVRIPFWWAIFPPSMEALHGLVMLGYHDTQNYFKQPGCSSKSLLLLRQRAKERPLESRLDKGAKQSIRNLEELVRRTWTRVFYFSVFLFVLLVFVCFSLFIVPYMNSL